jgi:hypothetical protein
MSTDVTDVGTRRSRRRRGWRRRSVGGWTLDLGLTLEDLMDDLDPGRNSRRPPDSAQVEERVAVENPPDSAPVEERVAVEILGGVR